MEAKEAHYFNNDRKFVSSGQNAHEDFAPTDTQEGKAHKVTLLRKLRLMKPVIWMTTLP